EVARGRHSEAPVVLVSDPAVADPTREVTGLRPLWTYVHVPRGSTRDMTAAVRAQLERFAPGFGDMVVASRCVPAAEMAETNANIVDGDIGGGALSMARIMLGPTRRWNPYASG